MQKLKLDITGIQLIDLSETAVAATRDNNISIEDAQGKKFHFVMHSNERNTILELEPVLSEAGADVQDIMSGMLNKILGARSLKETLAYCVKQVKDIIGYDRVMIYRFAEDGHGEVVAEDLNERLEPFFGLHYPASDIPMQARELYKRNLVRIIADVDSTDAKIEVSDVSVLGHPLDMTDSILRAVSPIHIQYLKNMGVKASFSVSLISNGELWGLIACHNYSAKVIDFKSRERCKIIGQLLSTSVVFREGEENKEQRYVFNEKMGELIRLIRKDWDIPAVLMEPQLNLLHLSEATGAALLFENQVYTIGETPTPAQLEELALWLKYFSKNQVYQTSHLSKDYLEAYAYKDVASGLMSCAISRELNEYIFWFKKELAQTIRWAGNPEKPVETDTNGLLSLSPRRSLKYLCRKRTVCPTSGTAMNWL